MDERDLSHCSAQLCHQVYDKNDINNVRAKLKTTQDAIDANGKRVHDEKENSDWFPMQSKILQYGLIRWIAHILDSTN